jgi:hypothetical protein
LPLHASWPAESTSEHAIQRGFGAPFWQLEHDLAQAAGLEHELEQGLDVRLDVHAAAHLAHAVAAEHERVLARRERPGGELARREAHDAALVIGIVDEQRGERRIALVGEPGEARAQPAGGLELDASEVERRAGLERVLAEVLPGVVGMAQLELERARGDALGQQRAARAAAHEAPPQPALDVPDLELGPRHGRAVGRLDLGRDAAVLGLVGHAQDERRAVGPHVVHLEQREVAPADPRLHPEEVCARLERPVSVKRP